MTPWTVAHRIFQTRILEWVATSFSRGSSWSRDWTWISCSADRFFTNWATREGPEQNAHIYFETIDTIKILGLPIQNIIFSSYFGSYFMLCDVLLFLLICFVYFFFNIFISTVYFTTIYNSYFFILYLISFVYNRISNIEKNMDFFDI